MASEINPFIVVTNLYQKKVDLDASLACANSRSCLDHVKEAFSIERTSSGVPKSIVASEQVVLFLENILTQLSLELKTNSNVLEDISEILRALRNSTSNSTVQNCIAQKTEIIQVVNDVFKTIVEIDSDNVSLKLLLQFLVNLVASNGMSTAKVYSIFGDNLLVSLRHKIYVYDTCALIYNISLQEDIGDSGLITSLLQLYDTDYSNEYIKFYLEKIELKSIFWKSYEFLSLKEKLIALTILKDLQYEGPVILHRDGLTTLFNIFLDSQEVFFQTSTFDDLKIVETGLCLDIMSSLSSNEELLPVFQTNKDIFITAGMLLMNIHRLGKMSHNCFTPMAKLSDANTVCISDHPAYGIKADLIRLIGNMCWKDKKMQDMARIADLIPVILESTNMDARNPFIIQWCILAIRNLCDGNKENQEIIAGLNHQGTVSSEVLEEMGLTLQSEGENKIKIVPLDSLKDNKSESS